MEDEILCRVLKILMALETERDLRLTLSTEANDLVHVLIRLRMPAIRNRRLDHPVPLLQNRVRFNLVHEAAFTFKSFANWTFHKELYILS